MSIVSLFRNKKIDHEKRFQDAANYHREKTVRAGWFALVKAAFDGVYDTVRDKQPVIMYIQLVDLMTRFSVHIKRLWFTHWHLTLTSFFRQQSNDDWFALHESEPEDRKRLRSHFVFWRIYFLKKYRPIVPSEPGKNCDRGI